jgi:hypothetical protein
MLPDMGMHGGFIVARCEWPDMRHVLEGHCGPLSGERTVSQAEWSRLPRGEDILHVASHGGCCYVLDPLMVLSSNSDLILTLSRQLSCPVIGAGAETVSGTFWFTAAIKGRLRRLHYDVKVSLTEPFDLGPRVDSESSAPFDHPDGIGILAATAAGGFDVRMLLHGPADGGTRFRWAVERFHVTGQLEQKLDEHARTHKRPDADHWERNVTVVPRDGSSYDIRAWPS